MSNESIYQPTSRRPIAGIFRRTATAPVGWCVRLNIHPDTISYASMVASAIAAVLFWQSSRFPPLLIVAPVFCYLRLWMNMLDGMVAIASGKASLRGELLNDLPDRVSDVLIFIGVAHSGWCNPFLGYWCAIAALLTAYVGMFGQAVGVQREFSGIMSKPWRMVALHIGAWMMFAMLSWRISSLSVLDWALIAIIAGCVQTIIVRLRRILKSLNAKSGGN